MRTETKAFLGALTIACLGYVLWPAPEAEEPEPAPTAKVELPRLESTEAYKRLQDARQKPLLPQGATPAERKRIWEQRMNETVATLEAEAKVRRDLDFSVPERLRELSPEAAGRLEQSNEMHEKWQEHRRKKIRQLEKLRPLVESELSSRAE